jgi:cytochrome c biogenesis protein CcdA
MGSKASLEGALFGGVACTLGLLTVFSIIGLAVSTLGSLATPYIPLLELIAGLAVISMGISIIVDIKFPTFITISRAPRQKGLIGIFLYGIVYGLATMGCSAPIFFSSLFYAFASGGTLYGTIALAVYAIGMGLPIIITTILVVKAKKLMLERMMKMIPWFRKTSGVVLIVVGVYLIYFYYVSFYAV